MKNKEDLTIRDILENEYIKCFLENRDELRKKSKATNLKIEEENKRQQDKKCKVAHRYNVEDFITIH